MFRFLAPTIALTLISSVVFGLIASFADPKPNNSLIVINLVYFFSSAFISLAGVLTLVLYSFGNLRLKKTQVSNLDSIHKPRIVYFRSLRHGFLLASAVVGIGLLNALDFSNPLNIALLVSALVLIEVYFFGH